MSMCPALSWRYCLNHSTFCIQSWYGGASSWGRECHVKNHVAVFEVKFTVRALCTVIFVLYYKALLDMRHTSQKIFSKIKKIPRCSQMYGATLQHHSPWAIWWMDTYIRKRNYWKLAILLGQKKVVLFHSVKVEVFSEFAIDKKLWTNWNSVCGNFPKMNSRADNNWLIQFSATGPGMR